MTITGTVTRVVRRTTAHGSVFLSVTIDRGDAGPVTMTYLKSFTEAPVKGQRITLEGMPVINDRPRRGSYRANIAAVKLTVHEQEPADAAGQAWPGSAVVATTVNCEIVLNRAGFYARCTRCPWVSEYTASKSAARKWANAHDNDEPAKAGQS